MHRDGFGFVIPEMASAAPSLKATLVGRHFRSTTCDRRSAMHGDRVLVEVLICVPTAGAEGRILRPDRTRAHPTVVGVFHYGARHNYVTPMDQKISQDDRDSAWDGSPGTNWSYVVSRTSYGKPAEDDVPNMSAETEGSSKQHRRLLHTNLRRTTPSKHRVLGSEASRRSDWSDLEKRRRRC